jgi:hypothetical protein
MALALTGGHVRCCPGSGHSDGLSAYPRYLTSGALTTNYVEMRRPLRQFDNLALLHAEPLDDARKTTAEWSFLRSSVGSLQLRKLANDWTREVPGH